MKLNDKWKGMTLSEIRRECGRLGAERLLQKRGRKWMQLIGRHGGDMLYYRRGSRYMKKIGRKGGQVIREMVVKHNEEKEVN